MSDLGHELDYRVEPFISTVEEILAKGGPLLEDYHHLDWAVRQIHFLSGLNNRDEKQDLISGLRVKYADVLAQPPSLDGHTFCKPRGYAGDFEIIDHIYDKHVSDDPKITRWDAYFQSAPFAFALRNRPHYFSRVIGEINPKAVVSLGSGSGQDILPIRVAPDIEQIILIDSDKNALARAKERYVGDKRVRTKNQNVLRPEFDVSADLVWSSGLFDYFNNRIFVRVLRRVLSNLEAPYTVIIGNFAKGHVSQAYMEVVGQWFLHLRTAKELRQLAQDAGVASENISIDVEPSGINLFLRISTATCA